MPKRKNAMKYGMNAVLELFKSLALDTDTEAKTNGTEPDEAKITVKYKDLKAVIELFEGFVDILDDGFQFSDLPALINFLKRLLN